MATFKTNCKYCQDEIILSSENENQKWHPYNLDRYYEKDLKYYDRNDIKRLQTHECRAREPTTKQCDYCDSEIYFSQDASGKYLPYNAEDDLRHFCKRNGTKH